MSQNEKLIKHLKNVGNISFMEAWNLYGVRSLPRRIADLKSLGYLITTEMKMAPNDQRYARYHLA